MHIFFLIEFVKIYILLRNCEIVTTIGKLHDTQLQKKNTKTQFQM